MTDAAVTRRKSSPSKALKVRNEIKSPQWIQPDKWINGTDSHGVIEDGSLLDHEQAVTCQKMAINSLSVITRIINMDQQNERGSPSLN